MKLPCSGPRLAAAATALALLLTTPSLGAPPRIAMSLTDSGTLPTGTVEDEEIVLAAADGSTRLLLNDQVLAYYLGDLNGDGELDEPNDIDALEIVPVPQGQPLMAGVYISLLSDQAGFKDGDVLRFHPGLTPGLEVVFSESFLVTAAAINDGNIDLDAIALDAAGALYFSLADDETVGAAQVLVQDEAVFLLPPGGATANVIHDGLQMEGMVSTALGQATTIGDVLGLDLWNGHLLFTVQSPSQHDATVFSSENGGSLFQGMVEPSLGFANAVEADAIAVWEGDAFPLLELSSPLAVDGDAVTLNLLGLAPSKPFLVLLSAVPMPAGAYPAAGFGAMALDPTDPMHLAALANVAALLGVSGPGGDGMYAGNAPNAAGQPYDLAVQVVDGSGRFSNPVLLEVNP